MAVQWEIRRAVYSVGREVAWWVGRLDENSDYPRWVAEMEYEMAVWTAASRVSLKVD